MGLIRRALVLRITLAAFTVFISSAQRLSDAPFTLNNKGTTVCLVKRSGRCLDVRWTTRNRLFVLSTKKCLGAQGRSVGSEVSMFDCNEQMSQQWECHNNTLLTLKTDPPGRDSSSRPARQLFVTMQTDESLSLSRDTGPNSQWIIAGTNSGPCTRTYRELYAIGGNAFGKPCMFPFYYKDRWYGDCTTYDSPTKRSWCAVDMRHNRELWGYCPTTSNEHWSQNLATRSYYQVNKESALNWAQAQVSCQQQGASLLSITDPNDVAYISALLGEGRARVWIGLVLDPEHGWQWSDAQPFRYMRWAAGNPQPNPGHNCAYIDTSGQLTWETSTCNRQLGYICYKSGVPPPVPAVEQGFCANPWIPYNGHCFHLHREKKTWPEAMKACRVESGDLLSVRHVEDHSFVISQLGYAAADELWIGLNDRRTEGLFEWSDQTRVQFTSWQYGEPSVTPDNEDCVLMTGENGNWADRSCEESHGFICMKQSSVEQTGEPEVNLDVGCKPGWKRHGSYCYFVGSATKTFDEANEDCKRTDSYLADVSNGVDNAFLVSLVGTRPENYFWIGLSNMKDLDQFVWTNTEQVRFTHWNTNMPGYTQGCTAIITGVRAGLWDLLPCTNTEKYICKHLAEGALVTVPPPTLAPPKCPEGWSKITNRNYCSKFFSGPRSEEKTWYEARDYCRAIGGDLLSIHSNDELRVGRHGRAWIGLYVPDANTGYAWSDGTPVNFQHWQEGEPNNFNNAESCVEFRIYNWDESGSWNDVNCEGYNDWLCQIRAGATLKPPPNATAPNFNVTADGWLDWRGNHYFINKMSMSMEAARAFCQRSHGDLVTITSRAENIFIWKQISRSYGRYYIGLSVDYDGSFWWKTNTPVEFLSWDQNQPKENTIDQNCVIMSYYMGFWGTVNCGEELKSICKRSASAPVNTTVAPTTPPTGGCPPTWIQFNSKCYSFTSNNKLTWKNALTQCTTMGGNMASIPTRNVQAFMTIKMAETTTEDLWIGLHSIDQHEYFWTDGKPRKFTNWDYSKQRRRPGSFYQRWNEEDCVALSSASKSFAKWKMLNCNDTNGYICQRDLDRGIAPKPGLVLPDVYVKLANDSVKVVSRNLTWAAAAANCEKDQAKLASLRNEWTQAYVELMAMTLKTPLWIGLNKNKTKGYFRYIDGWSMKFSNWDGGEPRQDRACVFVDVGGQWRTSDCNTPRSSVCLQTTDVAPTDSSLYPGVCPEEVDVDYRQSSSWIPFKSNCYLFMSEEVEWADASSSCIRHGGNLASIRDPSEQDFIKTSLEMFQGAHSSFWVGLFKTHKGTWQWLDKSVMDYTNWGEAEPVSEYGEVQTSDGKWRTGRRWHDRAYICQTAKVPAVDGPTAQSQVDKNAKTRTRSSLAVVLVILVISGLAAGAIFYYKRSPRSLPTFENPLYTERSQPDVVDTGTLIERADPEPEPEAETEKPSEEPIISL